MTLYATLEFNKESTENPSGYHGLSRAYEELIGKETKVKIVKTTISLFSTLKV